MIHFWEVSPLKNQFFKFGTIIAIVGYLAVTIFGPISHVHAVTFDNRSIIEHWDDPRVQDAYYNWQQYVQIDSRSKTDSYSGDQYNAQGMVENDWLRIGRITDETDLLLLCAAIIGAANPMATGAGDGWQTELKRPDWENDLKPNTIV